MCWRSIICYVQEANTGGTLQGVGFVYWTKKPSDLQRCADSGRSGPEQVAALLEFDPQADPDPNMFYMAGVAGNGARLLVRYWVCRVFEQGQGESQGLV